MDPDDPDAGEWKAGFLIGDENSGGYLPGEPDPDFTWTNPFDGKVWTADTFFYNGRIEVTLEYEFDGDGKFVTEKDPDAYTAADFPELEGVRYVLPNPGIPALTIYLKDYSAEVTAAAIDALYKRGDVSFARPSNSFFSMCDELFLLDMEFMTDEYIKSRYTDIFDVDDGATYTITYASDAEFKNVYESLDAVESGSTVYYKITCRDGYFVQSVGINAVATNNSFIMPEGGVEFDVRCICWGDGNKDGKLTTDDVIKLLRYFAGSTTDYWEMSTDIMTDDNLRIGQMDFDRNGRINTSDAIWMLRAIAGWKNLIPEAAERETDYTLSCLADVPYESYLVRFDGLTKHELLTSELNKKAIVTDKGDLADLAAAASVVEMTAVTAEGPAADKTDAVEWMAKFDDAFFAEHDIIVDFERCSYVEYEPDGESARYAPEYRYMEALPTLNGTSMTYSLVKTVGKDIVTNVGNSDYNLTVIIVPKGSVTEVLGGSHIYN